MIPKSLLYKAVRRNDNIIIAEGSKETIARMCKADRSLYIGMSGNRPMIGQTFGAMPEVKPIASDDHAIILSL